MELYCAIKSNRKNALTYSWQCKLRITWNRKFFIKIGFSLLVVSIPLPFATDFSILVSMPPHPTDRAVRFTFWSFMQIYEVLMRSGDMWLLEEIVYVYFYDYWSWWGLGLLYPPPRTLLPYSILIPIFAIQIVAVAFGLIVLLSAYSKLKMLLLIGILTTLDLLYLFFMQGLAFNATPHIGFVLSVASTTLFALLMVHSKILNNSPKT